MTPERWQQVKSVLEEVLEKPSDARQQFLAENCAGDSELVREVESLLVYEEGEPAWFEDASVSDVFQPVASAFVGKQIGKYRIVRELGIGGMGAVFLAERNDGEFEQQVAVKLLKQAFFSQVSLNRFRRERQILARLRHRYIAQLLDGGTTAEGAPFLVMEYVEGTPITRFAAEKNLSLEERLDLFRKVCEAVSFAHQNLIVHRDLKPDNILICPDGTPKLLDFGIAKLISETEIKATVTRQQALTPEYASPEQITGDAITTASDIYCLGIILFELLTGEHPFQKGNMTAQQMWRAITESEPARPSLVGSKFKVQSPKSKVQSPNEVNPKSKIQNPKSLRGDLDNIVLKALRREPERRYASVAQFSQDIKLFLSGFPVSARPDTFFYRAKKFVTRSPIASFAVLIAIVSLIAGIVAATYQARLANVERERAERRFNDVRQLANSFLFEINEEIEKSPVKAREKLVARALEYLDKLAQESEGNTELQSELAAAYEKIGNIQSELFKPSSGKTADALVSHQKSLEIREKLFAAEPKSIERGLDVIKSRSHVGDIFSMSGRVGEARDSYRQAILLNEQLLALAPDNFEVKRSLYRIYARLGQAVLRSGSLGEALENYEHSLAITEKLLSENPDNAQIRRAYSIIHSYIGYVKMEMGAGAAAVRDFQISLEVMQDLLAKDANNAQARGDVGTARLWLGVALSETGKTDEAKTQIRQALEIQQTIFEADRANFGEQNALADSYLELGKVLAKDGQTNEAIAHYEQAIKNYEAVWQADPKNLSAQRQIALTRRHLAVVLAEKGETARAFSLLRETLGEFEKLIASDPNNTEWQHDSAICHLRLGEMLLKKGEKAEAAAHFEKASLMLETLTVRSPENIKMRDDLETVKDHLEKR